MQTDKYNNLGKIPPQAIEFEESLLGKIMIEKEAFYNVYEKLEPRYFYKEAHRLIYQAMIMLNTEHKPIDIITVTEQLRKTNDIDKVGGAYYITMLTSRVASASNIDYYTMVVIQKFIAREVIRITSESQDKAFDESIDIGDVLDYVSMELSGIDNVIISGKPLVSLKENINLSINALQERGKAYNERGLYGLTTGLGCLNMYLNGWQKSDLVIIAARPSVGKTALSLHMAKSAAKRGNKVLYFSAEMSTISITTRLIMGETNIDPDKFIKGDFDKKDWNELETNIGTLLESHLVIDDKSSMTTVHIQNTVRKLVREQGIDIIFVDYIQYIKYLGKYEGDRTNEIGQMSREFKNIAKEYSIPVIVMSQLNREKEKRGASRGKPQLSDLRGSGDIEQDADVVILLDRDIYANQEFEDDRTMDIILAKNRNGAVGEFEIYYSKGLTRFSDMKESEEKSMVGIDKNYEPSKETDIPF